MLNNSWQRTAQPAAVADEPPLQSATTRGARRASAPSLVVHSTPSGGVTIPEQAICDELERVLASRTFQLADRLRRFVSFVVREGAAGRGGDLKEYVIGVHVFDKKPVFDPRTDPIVRVQARRLRARLVRYYLEEGQHDDVIIDLPKGGYAPAFRRRDRAALTRASLGPAPLGRNTVAVLPFADHSTGATLDGFCRGLRDEIVHALTSLGTLCVVPPDEVDAANRSPRSDPALIISGSVRDAGDHVRVTMQLLDRASWYYVWSEATNTRLADPIAAQQAIAQTVAARFVRAHDDSLNPRTHT